MAEDEDYPVVSVNLVDIDGDGVLDPFGAEFLYTPIPLVVGFSYEEDGLTVQFNDESTGTISTIEWDFGDGTTSNELNPNHTYSEPGNYTVTVTITDVEGNTQSFTQTITIVGSMATTHLDRSAYQIFPNLSLIHI